MTEIRLQVDGIERLVNVDADTPLLYVLTGPLALRGPKFGCGLAQCGACTVIIDGSAVRSCVLPASSVAGVNIRTLDGLAQAGAPHPVQAAFIAEEAAQCGYCTNGWIMTAVAALERDPDLDEAGIRAALAGLKCRCGTHMAMLRAVRRAAATMRS
jgi:nicotinate dehydrogenase subunit A